MGKVPAIVVALTTLLVIVMTKSTLTENQESSRLNQDLHDRIKRAPPPKSALTENIIDEEKALSSEESIV